MTTSLGFVLCKGKLYPEYEEYYEGMDKNQQQAFNKSYIRSYRKNNDTMKHFPRDKLATMDEYLDTYGRGTMLDNVLYDVLKEKYDRDKAMQKYAHPDDQEMYMAVRKYTPTLASSEISNWIHDINSRYRNILGINETSTSFMATQKSTTIIEKSTKFSTRITIFKKGYNPFASIESNYEYTAQERLTRRYPKRKIEPIQHDVEALKQIFSTQATSIHHNVTTGQEYTGMMEALVQNYFKSQSLKFKESFTNSFGFQKCPTGSPQSQEKLLKKFEELMKVPDMRIEHIFRTYENRSVYNSSYIEEYIRAMNFSTMWVSDLPLLQNITHAQTFITGRNSELVYDNDIKSETSTCTTEHTLYNIAVDDETPKQMETSLDENLLEDNFEDLDEEQRKIENSIISLGKKHEKGKSSEKEMVQQVSRSDNDLKSATSTCSTSKNTSYNKTVDDETLKQIEISPYENLVEDNLEDLEVKRKIDLEEEKEILEPEPFVENIEFNPTYSEESKLDKLVKEEVPRKEHTSIKKETTDYRFYYNQDKIFKERVFQNPDDLVVPRIVDKLDPSLENKFDTATVDALPRKNYVDQTGKHCSQGILEQENTCTVSPSSVLNTVKTNPDNLIPERACHKCNQTHQAYNRKYNRRHRKHHRSHKRRHRHGHRGLPYPPNPFAYNAYYPPPPPYPYPPQYYPPPQPPNFYHFTSEYPGDNQPDSILMATPENQFDLYLKLKNIFKPVDKVLKGKLKTDGSP